MSDPALYRKLLDHLCAEAAEIESEIRDGAEQLKALRHRLVFVREAEAAACALVEGSPPGPAVLTITRRAELALRAIGRPARTKEILARMALDGYAGAGSWQYETVYGSMRRNAAGRFVLLGRGVWGLSEWAAPAAQRTDPRRPPSGSAGAEV